MKIAVTSTGNTLESPIDPRFGRCQFFVFIDGQADSLGRGLLDRIHFSISDQKIEVTVALDKSFSFANAQISFKIFFNLITQI